MRGFTLIELMIVVAVVGILATIAYPSFNEAVLKSRRGQAKADLLENMQMAERWHTSNNTYVGYSVISAQSPRETGSTSRYTISVNPAAAQNTITITATPTSGSGQERDRCGTLTLNQAGAKTSSKGTVAECW